MPDYTRLKFDRARAKVDELPERNHLNSYNTFSVLQEVQRALGLWTQAPTDYWEIRGRFQDPYRRLVIADTPEYLMELVAGLDALSQDGFAQADHFVFTFGMSEVFVNESTGLVANQKPGYCRGGGVEETVFKNTSVAENTANILAISDLIAAEKPEAKIILTVSPVPLSRTFSGQDIVVANTQSKSVIRAAIGEAMTQRSNLIYMPSYERVMQDGRDSFEEDGRHVRRPVVAEIVQAFVEAHFEDPNAI
ncbi:MAG: GSCFA domain-containing protein [Pseudomonadota bacterium]